MSPGDIRERVQNSLAASYTILRELGGGGMSHVFVAEERALGRMVVVKVLAVDRSEGVSAERFVREIKLVARLQHPHIVPLFATGLIDGVPYYTMPYIDGESLRARLSREKALGTSETIHILGDIAKALDYAHSHGVVHRDIKPDNVLISGSAACVADFGIARALKAARTGPTAMDDRHQHSGLTRMGMAVGTPAYMSPEQATSSPDVDHRADLYSFGCVAFELLTGSPPFTGRSPVAMLAAHVVEAPPVARLRHPRIPPALADLVVRCLQKSPDDRPASAAEILKNLDSIPSRSSGSLPAVEVPASIAVLPFENMSTDKDNEYFSDGISEEIINALTQIDGLRVAGRTSSFAFKGTKVDLATVGEQLNVDTVLEGSVRKAGNRLRITAQLIKASDGYHLWSERFDRELTDVFAVQDEIATAIASKLKLSLNNDSGELAKPLTTSVEAYELFVKARTLYYLPSRQIVDAIKCFEQAVALDEKFALAHAALADALSLSCYYGITRPVDVMDRAHAAAWRALELAPDNPDIHHAVALWTTFFGDENTAIAEWNKLGPRATLRAQVRCSYAIWYLGLLKSDWNGAVDEIIDAIALDPLNGFAHSMLAMMKTFAGQTHDVVEYARRGVELHPTSFLSHLTLQRALHCVGMHADSQAHGIATLDLSGRHPYAMAELAVDYAAVGNRDGAEAIYQEMSARGRLQYIQPSPLALAATSAGCLDDAVAICERAIAERDPHIFWAFTEVWDGWQPLHRHPRWSDVQNKLSESRRETH
jgi:serine/threonine-protein kinase